MVSGPVTFEEKFGLDTVAETDPGMEALPPVALPDTVTVTLTASAALGAMPLALVQESVPTVQTQLPLLESVMAVAVSPAGSVTVSVRLLGSATVELVLVTSTVMVSVVSPSLKMELLGLVVIVSFAVGRTTGSPAAERSKMANSSIFSCGTWLAPLNVGHSLGNVGLPDSETFST